MVQHRAGVSYSVVASVSSSYHMLNYDESPLELSSQTTPSPIERSDRAKRQLRLCAQPVACATPHHPACTIHKLPAELLLIIFKLVYDMYDKYYYPKDRNSCRDTMASVCSAWRHILLLAPEFWTHIVIHLDMEPFSVHDITERLERCRHLMVDVTVTSKLVDNFKFMTRELEENRRARCVTAVLCLHICHCESIKYNLAHSSSLPLILPELYYSTPHLKELCLNSSARSGGSPSGGVLRLPRGQDVTLSEWCFPAMTELVLDGWNFIELCHNNPKWTENGASCAVSLSVVHFRPSNTAWGRFSVHSACQYLSCIPHLDHLGLHDVEFEPELPHVVLPDDFSFSSISLSDLSSELTADVLFYANISTELQTMTITRCPLIFDDLPFPWELILNDIPTTQDFINCLSFWSGSELQIHNSPSFNDEVLEMLSEVSDTGEMVCASDLMGLEIQHCPNFSIAALQRMVAIRQHHDGKLYFLSITPEVSRTEKQWLETQVEQVGTGGQFC